MKKGDQVILKAGTHYYWNRTQEELNALYEGDEKSGRTLDDAGEPRIHSRMGVGTLSDDTCGIVMKTRGLSWSHWTRRPVGLIECLITLGETVRTVYVVPQ